MDETARIYKAIANDPDDSNRGIRVAVLATSLKEAKRMLVEKYGAGNFIDLHSEEEAGKPR